MRKLHPTLRFDPGSLGRAAQAVALLVASAGALPAQETTARGPYFGQNPPGATPSVFAPGIISLPDRYEYAIAFSTDGTECSFGVTNSDWSTCDLYYAKQVNGAWSKPAKAPFQQGPDGWLPSFTPDGKRLLFSSGRPDMRNADSYLCERTADGWGAPEKLGAPVNSPGMDWRPTLTSSGTLYFTSNRDSGPSGSDIFRSVPVDGRYLTVEKLGPPIDTSGLDSSPCVSLDGQVLIFESWRPGGHGQGDLYVSYVKRDGSWTSPQNLGPPINTEQIEDSGYISPDGKYFFFNRREAWVTERQTDIYWVDIRAVFKPYVLSPAGDAGAMVGEPFSLRLPAGEFADYDDGALAYSASSAGGGPLPGWLSFDPKTRTLTGTPDTAGSFAIEITATDSMGSASSDVLTIRSAR